MNYLDRLFSPNPAIEVTVEVLDRSKKAIKVKSPIGQVDWIPRRWIIKKQEISPDRWKIKIREFDWVQKFS